MELRAYLNILWRRKWVIAVTVTVTMIIVVTGTLLMPPIYTASTVLRVATIPEGSLDYLSYDVQYADRLMNTYVQMATNGSVITELENQFGLTDRPNFKAEILTGTELIKITVEDRNPTRAAQMADTVAGLLIAQVSAPDTGEGGMAAEALNQQLVQIENELNQAQQEYENLVTQIPEDSEHILAVRRTIDLKQATYATLLKQQEQIRLREALRANSVSIIEPAVVPQTPSKPRKELNIALGFLVALAGGTGLAFLFENLDTRLYTIGQIENIPEFSVLGTIPTAKKREQITSFGSNSAREEAFRRLRTNIFTHDNKVPLQTLMVTSAAQGEGKSTIVANLALAIAQSKRKVVVVDSDLRLPTLHTVFNLPNEIGLSSVLKQGAILDEAIQSSSFPRIHVLTSGPLPSNPAELLGSPQMTAVLWELTQRFDVVLLDTPALLPVADAAVLAPAVNGVVLVVSRAQARKEDVQAACQQLADVKARVVGLVMNRAPHNGSDRYYTKS